MAEIVGGVVGAPIGLWLRRSYFKRKLRRTKEGRRVKVRARAHPEGSPEWRYWRGAVVQYGGTLKWRAVIRRWRTIDLTVAQVLGSRLKRSAADGDRLIIELAAAGRADHLAVSTDAAPIVEEMLRRLAGDYPTL